MSDWGSMNAARMRNAIDLQRLAADIQGARLGRRQEAIGGMVGTIGGALDLKRKLKFYSGESEKERQFRTSEREAAQMYGTGEREAGQDFRLGEGAETERRRLQMYKDNPDLFTILRDLERIMNPPSGEKSSEEKLLDDPNAYLMNNWANWVASRQLTEPEFGSGGIATEQWDAWKGYLQTSFPDYATPAQRKRVVDAVDGFINIMTVAGQAEEEPTPEPTPPGHGGGRMGATQFGEGTQFVPEERINMDTLLESLTPYANALERRHLKDLKVDVQDNVLQQSELDFLERLIRAKAPQLQYLMPGESGTPPTAVVH